MFHFMYLLFFYQGDTSLVIQFNSSTGAAPPTDSFILIDWKDGTTTGPLSFDPNNPPNISHIYVTGGHFVAEILIYNLGSELLFTKTVRKFKF